MSNIKKIEQLSQVMLFKKIWQLSEKKSFVSNLFLRDFIGTAYEFNLFAHVLPKALNKYQHFRLYAKNIVLLSPQEHHLWDNGTKELRNKYAEEMKEKSKGKIIVSWDKLEKYAELLQQEYNKVFPKTVGLVIGYKYSLEEVSRTIGKLNNEYFKLIS